MPVQAMKARPVSSDTAPVILTSALDGGGLQLHDPTALTPRKTPVLIE